METLQSVAMAAFCPCAAVSRAYTSQPNFLNSENEANAWGGFDFVDLK